jgi:AcrR family transcriptional regulator
MSRKVTTKVSEPHRESAARRRLLGTARRLFYTEGIHTVGIDRIIAEAGVAKATFYNHFASKDELVRAYIQGQDQSARDATFQLPQQPPRAMIFAILDRIGEAALQPGYRGCPFMNATAEYADPAHPVREAISEHRQWYHDFLRGLLAADGHTDPGRTAEILVILSDGLLSSGYVDDPTELRELTREAVTRVLDGSR